MSKFLLLTKLGISQILNGLSVLSSSEDDYAVLLWGSKEEAEKHKIKRRIRSTVEAFNHDFAMVGRDFATAIQKQELVDKNSAVR